MAESRAATTSRGAERSPDSHYRTVRRLAIGLATVSGAAIAAVILIASSRAPRSVAPAVPGHAPPAATIATRALPTASTRPAEAAATPVAVLVDLQVSHERHDRSVRSSLPVAPIVLRIVGGPAWVSLRLRAADGTRLFEGTLPAGRTIRLERGPLWVLAGAPERLFVSLGGRPARPLPGFARTILLSGRGFRVITRHVPPPAATVAPAATWHPPAEAPAERRPSPGKGSARSRTKPLPSTSPRASQPSAPAGGTKPRRKPPAPGGPAPLPAP